MLRRRLRQRQRLHSDSDAESDGNLTFRFRSLSVRRRASCRTNLQRGRIAQQVSSTAAASMAKQSLGIRRDVKSRERDERNVSQQQHKQQQQQQQQQQYAAAAARSTSSSSSSSNSRTHHAAVALVEPICEPCSSSVDVVFALVAAAANASVYLRRCRCYLRRRCARHRRRATELATHGEEEESSFA
ncbi:GH12302 [Drosophila grimshawi]|uniref:GH12302 n=1 Tax=Drosophila grimshawi TaxID=7222 RepID=B4JJ93_DROGR|nr:GH12302 [Drosophila grimshawi]